MNFSFKFFKFFILWFMGFLLDLVVVLLWLFFLFRLFLFIVRLYFINTFNRSFYLIIFEITCFIVLLNSKYFNNLYFTWFLATVVLRCRWLFHNWLYIFFFFYFFNFRLFGHNCTHWTFLLIELFDFFQFIFYLLCNLTMLFWRAMSRIRRDLLMLFNFIKS